MKQLGTGRTGGREASTGLICGRYALAVGMPQEADNPAPDGWKWTLLSQVAQLESGHTPSRKHPEYWDGDIPWIGIKDIVNHHGQTINETIQHVTQAGLDNSSARLLPANTVCLSRTASVGYVTVMGRPMATSQDFINWVCGPEIEPQFLKFVLVAENEALWRFASGTTHQTIYYPEAKAFHVCLPPVKEQRAIASILGSLDDKIELNRQMNATLEALAQTLFRAWFVEFEPVKARAEGRAPVGLDEVTSALFPATFEDEGPNIGLPKGWTFSAIGEEVRVVGGSTPSTKNPDFWDGENEWATPKDLSNQESFFLLATERRITDEGLAKIGSGSLPTGSVLLSSRAPIGYLAIATQPVAINQGFIGMICEQDLPNYYVLFWTQENMDMIKSHANGSTFQEISKSNFRPLPMTKPPQNILDAFSNLVSPIMARIENNVAENRTLSQMRDQLLPRLLNGSLRVPDVGTHGNAS